MTYDVFRLKIGLGLVDYLGTVEADSEQEAEDCARLMFDVDHASEKLEVEEAAS